MNINIRTICISVILFCFDLSLHAVAQAQLHYCQSSDGVVAAARKGSSEAGITILEKGGNAADAAAATILALSVADYGPFCIGGEAPLMLYDSRKKEVFVYSGMGTAPLDPKAIDWYMANGIPEGDMKASAVPSIISLCIQLLIDHGTMTFAEVVKPTLELLDQKDQPWCGDLIDTINRLIEAEQKNTPGDRIKGLEKVNERFYKGDIAKELVKWYGENGGFLSRKDLAEYKTRIEKPLKISYKGYEIFKCDTWTQGAYLLQTLNILEKIDLKSMGYGTAEYLHTITEAVKLGLADRDKYYGDPLFVNVPVDQLLSKEYADSRRTLIDEQKALNHPRPGDLPAGKSSIRNDRFEKWPGGTTTCVVADKYGNLVAATPSGWGSNAGTGGNTGVTHGTRLISLNTSPGHPNCIQPGKRPRITLTPTIILKDGLPYMGISVEGGDVQDQATLQIILNILEFGMSPEEAINAPRIATTVHEDSFNPSRIREETIDDPPRLQINSEIDDETMRKLKEKGHNLDVTSDAIGVPAIVMFDDNGQKYAATDRKTDHYVNKTDER